MTNGAGPDSGGTGSGVHAEDETAGTNTEHYGLFSRPGIIDSNGS